jgi:Dimethlysulfonioproprionate lyase
MNASAARGSLLALAHRMLNTLTAPALAPFLADWPVSAGSPKAQCAAHALPVMRWLPRIAADNESFDPVLVRALCDASTSLEWRQTYTIDEVDAAFLENYGWTELLGPAGLAIGGKIACGVMVLGPRTLYPHHRHEAEEIYVPLSGTAAWQQGDAVWRPRAPGTLIHHLSEEPHAMRTGEEPLMAMYLWRSANLSQEARLDRRRTE